MSTRKPRERIKRDLRDIEDMREILAAPARLTREQARDAALVICGNAHDADDARQLLAACGIGAAP